MVINNPTADQILAAPYTDCSHALGFTSLDPAAVSLPRLLRPLLLETIPVCADLEDAPFLWEPQKTFVTRTIDFLSVQ